MAFYKNYKFFHCSAQSSTINLLVYPGQHFCYTTVNSSSVWITTSDTPRNYTHNIGLTPSRISQGTYVFVIIEIEMKFKACAPNKPGTGQCYDKITYKNIPPLSPWQASMSPLGRPAQRLLLLICLRLSSQL